jgi:hypothetical protein
MGQAGNSNRRATLDDRKQRAAGRNNEREAIKQAVMPRDMKGKTGGAFGADGKANRRGNAAVSQGAGGGGGGPAPARDEVTREAGRSSRPTRKRKA